MKGVTIACLVALSLGNIGDWAPAQPRWPSVFTASWNEQTSYTGPVKYTGGVAFYDYPNGHLNWTRWDGDADPVCNSSLPLPYDTQCAHMVADGNHYLYAPILDQCCLCCTEENGCGVPSSSGMDSLSFVGQSQYLGRSIYYWQRLINGYTVDYLETAEIDPLDRQWAALFSLYDNYTNVWEFNSQTEDQFQLPSKCAGAGECGGICTYLRNQGTGKLRGTSQTLYKGLPFF